MDLKAVLMNLGNKLVTEHGYNPGFYNTYSTKPIVDFTNFLNESPEARVILQELGLEWSMVEKK
jgi:hypothetical protein